MASLLAFGAKGLLALAITYWLANALSVEDFALWATVFSLGMILSVADFGVGQLVLTTFHERPRSGSENVRLLTNAVAGMALLSGGLFVVGCVAIASGQWLGGVRWSYVVMLLIVARLVFIPYGAVLSAHERYHERRVIEAASYALGAVFIWWSTRTGASVALMLLGMNACLTLGSLVTAGRAAQLGLARVTPALVTGPDTREVFRESLPYFVNNVSGLAIYGGFIAISSMLLAPAQTAKLSLLHSLVFMHLFQVFELIFRTSQTRLRDERLVVRLKVLVAVTYAGSVVAVAGAGPWLFKRFVAKYDYSVGELIVYLTFGFLEVYYLLLTSKLQMESARKRTLQSISLLKAAGFAGAVGVAAVVWPQPTLLAYSWVLVAFSLVMACAITAVMRPAASESLPDAGLR